jgi:transcription initiation factor IIE alpha subunit
MSYKLTCPSCDTYTSANFRAYEDGRPCPNCGASLQASSSQYYRQLPDDHHWDPPGGAA